MQSAFAPDHEGRSGEACARRPCGEEARRLAFLHQTAADHERGVLLLSHGAGGVLAHIDHLGGNVRLAAHMVRGERGHHLVRPAQNDLERRIGFKRCCDTFEHDGRRVVAAHGVNCKNGSGKRLGRSARSGQFARFPSQGELLSGRRDCTHLVKKPPVRAQGRTEMGGSRLAYVKKLGRTRRARKPLFGLDDFAVLVEAAVRAHAMRKLHFAALRAHGTRRCVDAVVSAATSMGACTTRFLLRYCHDLAPL